MNLSTEQAAAANSGIRGSDQIVIITGFAGCGKSVVCREIISKVQDILVCSQDGIAAQNIDGVTSCSQFGIPTSFQVNPKYKDARNQRKKDPAAARWNNTKRGLPKSDPFRFSPIKAEAIRVATHLLIDEAFRQSCWSTDFISKTCQQERNCYSKPFGGLKVIFVGDDGQGQPILKGNDREELRQWDYEDPYDFRSARCLEDLEEKGVSMIQHDLSKVFRQTEGYDSMVLSRFRTGTETEADLDYLNTRVVSHVPSGVTVITPRLYKVAQHNDLGIERLRGEPITFTAKKKGCFVKWEEKRLPFPTELTLKPGCRIIIKQNIKRKVGAYIQEVFNGEQGTYESMDKYGRLLIRMDRGDEVYLKKEKKLYGKKVKVKETCLNPDAPSDIQVWEMKKSIVEDEANAFEQYPIRLGYAITITASQGSTMPRVHIDLTDNVINKGDLYVALSRVSGGFQNLTLSRPLTRSDNKVATDLKIGKGEQFDLF